MSGIVAPGLVAAEAGPPADALRVCLPAADPPRSERVEDGRGLDLAVVRHLARKLSRPLHLAWLPERPQTDIESTDLDFRPLLRGECDVQFSVPGIEAIGAYRGRLELSAPYYGAAYELIPADATLRWGQPFDGTVAVRGNTVAHVVVAAAGLSWRMQARPGEIVNAVAGGSAAVGLIWGPHLAGLDTAPQTAFEAPPLLRFNMHAVVRSGDPLLVELDRAFADDDVKKTVLDALHRHGMPARAPFDSVFSSTALAQLRSGRAERQDAR